VVRIAAAGDICSSPSACNGTGQLIQNRKLDWALTLVDNQYTSGTSGEFANGFDRSAWGTLKRTGKILPSTGNHDWQTAGAGGYCGYFGPVAACGQGHQYSKDLGDWTVIAMDTNGGMDSGEVAQISRFMDEANARGDNVLLYGHHPRWAGTGCSCLHGPYPNQDAAWKALMQRKADLVLWGHDHDVQVFRKLNASGQLAGAGEVGVRAAIIGTGGSRPDPPPGNPMPGTEYLAGNLAAIGDIELAETPTPCGSSGSTEWC
jgi:acid phosphatase type 7